MASAMLVVGAGPVGLTMAAELTRYGVPVRIIDRAPQRTTLSKALVVWSRTLELLNRMGCAEAFVSAGMKVNAANIIAGDKTIAHVQLNALETPYPYALMIAQSETERLLETQLSACGVQVERSVELLRFTSGTDNVTATLRRPDGVEESLEVDYLLGCDGAHSAVRHGLGIPFEGDTQPSDWILGDLNLAGLRTKADELNLYWHAEGALALFPISAGRYRVIADVGDAKQSGPRPDPTLEEIQAILDRRGPGKLTASDPIWLASFRINERKVADYRVGRVFLAGDAAHVHSPAGGQGMNTGMQDAINLAWKLALVHRGIAAPEPLLESYNAERSAVGRQVLNDAGRLTTVAILKSGVAQSIRNHVASLLFGLSSVRGILAEKLAELSIGYPHGPLTVPARHRHSGPAPGQRVPLHDTVAPVGSGDTPRFALFAPASEAATALLARYRDVMEPVTREPLAAETVWLVRPDGYVAVLTGPDEWHLIANYLQRVMGS